MRTNYSILLEHEFYHAIKLGKKVIDGRLVIPSGIRCTKSATIEYIFNTIPSIGIITTKSISLNPKQGYKEPIYVKYGDWSFLNAVGLANPGAKTFKEELSKIIIPANKFLLVSIFGGNALEFTEAAKILESVADGFELNMSCPHAQGYGLEIGYDPRLVYEITGAVVHEVKIPVIVKLSATCIDIDESARSAIKAGAVGITTTNTVGPGLEYQGDMPTLSNKFGGMSGDGIRPLGLKSVYKVREAIGPDAVIIGMGGISQPQHIKDYYLAGADFFAIGSALTTMNSHTAQTYFDLLERDIINNKLDTLNIIKSINLEQMSYNECHVVEIINLNNNLFKLILDDINLINDNETAGKFFFLMIPGIGEKPFAIFSKQDRSFIIKKVGYFTEHLSLLKSGSRLYIRGAYGCKLPDWLNSEIFLVGGGTGISPLYEIAKKYYNNNKIRLFFGTKSMNDLFEMDYFNQFGNIEVATEDGSYGFKGIITELMENILQKEKVTDNYYFINCGPEPMVRKCFDIQQQYVAETNVFGSIEYYTSCGVGICGKCATPSGKLSCVDGPFFPMESFREKCACRV